MTNKILYGFNLDLVLIKLENIIYTKAVTKLMLSSRKYEQILSSVQEIGLVESPVVTPDKSGSYILLDGHLRMEVLKSLHKKEVQCLVSKNNESYTYNKYVNSVSCIQENRMIINAVERGVPKDKLCRALNICSKTLGIKLNLLNGICPQVADILKYETTISNKVFFILKKMKEQRQIEAAYLMKESRNFTVQFAEVLYASTPKELLVAQTKKIKGLSEENIAHLEVEEKNLKKEFSAIEHTYQSNVFNLILIKGYLEKLLSSGKVEGFLNKNHPELLSQFYKIGKMTSLSGV